MLLAQSAVSLYGDNTSILTIAFLGQNYHPVHHICPQIPFYLYESVWFQVKDELAKRGQLTIPLFGGSTKSKES